MPFVDVDQLSDDWLKMRVGCVSASHMCDVMAKLKPSKDSKPNPKEAAPRLIYRKKKVAEMLSGLSAENYVSRYMDDGIENEILARASYEVAKDVEVQHGGLYIHDQIDRFVASPDGRIGDDGLLEAKYLTGFTTESNHLDLIMGASIPDEYQLQMLAQMACSGRQWVDFVSFDRRMPKNKRLFVKRFNRDEARIAEIEAEVRQFLKEVDAMLLRLAGDGDLTAALEASLQVSRQ